MKLKQRTLILLGGVLWLAIGTFLLVLGLSFVMKAVQDPIVNIQPGSFSLLLLTKSLIPDYNNAVIALISFGLLVGLIKGRVVLRKTVDRQVNRIAALPDPAHLKHLYTKGHYLLIASMIGLGLSLRFLPITLDTRGIIDVAVGSALINGALLYLRYAINYNYLKNGKS